MRSLLKILVITIGIFLSLNSVTLAAQYTYDELGRLILVKHENDSSIQYTYDAAGNITSITRSGTKEEEPIEVEEPSSGGGGVPPVTEPPTVEDKKPLDLKSIITHFVYVKVSYIHWVYDKVSKFVGKFK